jgi:hypothetical protein
VKNKKTNVMKDRKTKVMKAVEVMTDVTQLGESWTDFMSRYPLEWFVHLTFKDEVSPEIARKKFLKWVRSLCVTEHLRIAAWIIYNPVNHSHLHALMLGHNKKGKTLKEVSIEPWQKKWSAYRYGCMIEPVYDLKGASGYCAKNILASYRENSSDVFFYDKKLLMKTREAVQKKESHSLAQEVITDEVATTT